MSLAPIMSGTRYTAEPDQSRHHHQEDHGGPMHGEDLVVGFRREELQIRER